MTQILSNNTLLQGGRYRIVETLGQGGFGITYLAIQSGLERKVAIKEFFMKEFCEREEATSHVTLGTKSNRETVNRFREKFLKEARNITRLNHPHIIRIFDVFEENGTAYYVMEYCENGSLADKVKREGALSEAVAMHYILQVADALDYIHQQKMNHLDVKPANILLNEKDEAVLIDFGLSKQYDVVTGSQTSTTPVGISNGYAPMEQYRPGGVSEFSPQTDIYSLGATFYMLLTGITPPSASDINEDGVPADELKAKKVKRKTISVICKAMKGRKKERLQDITSFVECLNGSASSSEGSNRTFTSKPASMVDDEATVVFVDTKKKEEEERKRIEAEAQARKEKTEAEARAQAEEEARALAEAERKAIADYTANQSNQSKRQRKSRKSEISVLSIVFFLILFIIVKQNDNNSGNVSSTIQSDTSNKSQALSLPQNYSRIEEILDSVRIADSIATAYSSTMMEYSVSCPETIDMGVSVLWAKWNVGASSVYDYGCNYYWATTYIDQEPYNSLSGFPNDISKTDKDIAYTTYGTMWRLPSRKDYDELRNNCDLYWHEEDNVKGILLVSKINGNTLFFPNYKQKSNEKKNEVFSDDSYPIYWTSECIKSYNGCFVYDLCAEKNNDAYRPSMRLPIRVVREKR